jgi:uncharacterized protein (DUF2141 family)
MRWIQLAFALTAFTAVSASAVPLVIQVDNVDKTQGSLRVALFASAESWDNEEPTSSAVMAELTKKTTLIEIDVEPGDYAFFLYHDVNDNGMLEKTFVGFPDEPYAFSNNYKLKFSKPKYTALKFTVPEEGVTHTVNLVEP